ncbi:MAG: class II glutamine amidotransferase [Deltaproteobacteria bacterium]|nr:class II glutamine amidotransferase [Deltaproteobacteria bacterium]
MCRFLAYRGAPIICDELLFKPENSLIHQSYCAREREEPLNGDGFGIGWYEKDIDQTPAVFVSIQPAWSNRNLLSVAPKIKTDCLFAHVRAATEGTVSESNCHPFRYENYLMMHNGEVGGFSHIKREVRRRLSDLVYEWVDGTTDTQHFYALFLDDILQKKGELGVKDIAESLLATIKHINEIKQKYNVEESCYLNLAVTDGEVIVATRYVSDPDMPAATLYYSEGSSYECQDGVCMMKHSRSGDQAVIVVSEKLTNIEYDWHEVPVNHIITVDRDLTVKMQPITE